MKHNKYIVSAAALLAAGLLSSGESRAGLTLSYITGMTQCLTADSTGQVTGTGAACGSGGGGGGVTPVGNSVLAGDGSGGLLNVTIGAGLNFDGAILSATGGGSGGAIPNGASGNFLTSNGANNFGTPAVAAAGFVTFMATPTSANLRALMSDEVGGGALYFVGGALGTPASVNLSNATQLPLATGVVGNLDISHLCGGTGANSGTVLHGDCTWSASGGSGGTIGITDTVNSVAAAATLTVDPKLFVITDGGGGAASLTGTSTVSTDRSAADYTIDPSDSSVLIPVGAGHTYTLAQAGSAGFGAGWGTCLQNVSTTGDATVTTSVSTFQGAGGGTSFLLPPQAWACPTSKSANWYTQVGYGSVQPGAFALEGTLFPTALAVATTNNYNPAGLPGAIEVQIDGGASDRTITGLAGGSAGRLLVVRNNGATNKLVFTFEDAGSTAANRFAMTTNVTLGVGGSRVFRYEAGTVNRWQPFGPVLGDSGVTPNTYTCANITVGVDGRVSSAASGTCSGSSSGITKAFAPIGWVAGVDPNKAVIMTATTAMTVTAIRGRVGDPVGAAATVAVNKAASGTACSAGTAQQTGGTIFDANGTAVTNQTPTLVGGGNNVLAAGDSLCLVTTGGANWTSGLGIGGLTVEYTTP